MYEIEIVADIEKGNYEQSTRVCVYVKIISQNEILCNISFCDRYNHCRGDDMRLRDLREDNDITQKALADYLHIK